MLKQLTIAALLAAGLFGVAATAQAQQLNMDLSGIMRWNMEQDQMAMQRAAQFSQDWYNARQEWRRQTGYYGYLPPPVTTQDMMRSNAELQQAYGRQHAAWRDQSDRQGAAVERWTEGAIRGQGTYYNPHSGQQVILPWTHQQYHQTPYGQYAPGVGPQYAPQFHPYYGG